MKKKQKEFTVIDLQKDGIEVYTYGQTKKEQIDNAYIAEFHKEQIINWQHLLTVQDLVLRGRAIIAIMKHVGQ